MNTADRILLVEDEPVLRDNIAMNLEMEGFEVKKTDNGHDAMEILSNEQFSAIVLDIMLPKASGLAVCEYARVNNNQTPILLLSAKSSVQDRITGLKMGADDYLTKPFDLEELLLRVTRLVEKSRFREVVLKTPAKGDTFSFGGHELDFTKGIVKLKDGTQQPLTKKEQQIMKVFCDNPNTLITREHILHTVWGYNVFPSTRTLDNFILQLRKTFEPDASKPIYLHARRGQGFEFTPEGEVTES